MSLYGAASLEGAGYHLKRPRHTQRQNPRIRAELVADLLQELNVSVAEAAAAFGACRSQLRLRTRMAPARSAENDSTVKASADRKVAQSRPHSIAH